RLIRHAEPLADQIRADAAGRVDGRQSASRVGAAADEIAVPVSLAEITGTHVEHLSERVRQIEGGPHEDRAALPVRPSDALPGDDAAAEILPRRALLDAAEDLVGVFLLAVRPIETMAGVDGGNQDVQAGLTGRGHVRIGD